MSRPVLADRLTEPAIELAARWLSLAHEDLRRSERRVIGRLSRIVGDPDGVSFTMQFVDRVLRHRDDAEAARELHALVGREGLPAFLSPPDRLMLTTGAALARRMPQVVIPLARRRLRRLVGHLVVDAEPVAMHAHLDAVRGEGFGVNVNLLGELVLGEEEASRRLQRTLELVSDPAVDYASIKISAIASQLDLWSVETTVTRIADRLRQIFGHAAASHPPTFVNLDMEEYRDLELTIAAFTRVLDEPELAGIDAGIVLQAYLPDSFGALQRLAAWSASRAERGGGTIRIRLVKGANLAMERVDADLHGWVQAPYETKHEVDACYKRCIDWALQPEHLRGIRIGVASHNLFDLAWALLLARERGVTDAVEVEMLTGISPAQARAVRRQAGSLRLYTPVVSRADFDIAIAYLFRRLEENAAPQNFIRHLWSLRPGSADFADQARAFRAAVADRDRVDTTPRRLRAREHPAATEFANEPDTDPSLPRTQQWLSPVRRIEPRRVQTPLTTTTAPIDAVLESAREAQREWGSHTATARRDVLRRVATELSARRADLLATMAREGGKTFAEADPEISEAIDFARWYGERALEVDRLQASERVAYTPFGVVAVAPPWNFPVAIPAGGVLASLAAGNSVVLKPTLETPRCAEIVAEACWAAGVPADVLHLVRTLDDDVGRHLVTRCDAVILTGSWETAAMFRSWRPDMRLFAETSGKNALVITPQADVDLAAADLVRSAFGHAGQKCSAASLAILVGGLADDERFLGKVLDAARSLRLGRPPDEGVTMGPLIDRPSPKLLDALTTLGPGEQWLLQPRDVDGSGVLWSPGIKTGVRAGSSFHHTECFGPVLGIMRAKDLDEAIALQNDVPYGLTGGIHSLDPSEVERWLDRVEVGNAYVNRHITGAIVRRQPFGGWKRSSVGPGAKAGGPDYVLQLGEWRDDDADLAAAHASASDAYWWRHQYGTVHDPSGLVAEQNLLRYLPRPDVVVRAGPDAAPHEVRRAVAAARTAGVDAALSVATEEIGEAVGGVVEDEDGLVVRLSKRPFARVRHVGRPSTALLRASMEAGFDVIDAPVVGCGRLELRWYVREQAISRTMHRFGNVLTGRDV
jgi:RHH-type proline utilization regulon transcriptional repressor/proline dehydrogenase/delta 1-pyrroline-5-carboxylate dehydrogenase